MPVDLASEGGALLGPAELAERTGYSARTLRRWTTAGWLPHVGPRHRPRYDWTEVMSALRDVAPMLFPGRYSPRSGK
jgi:hypothetical protein